MRLEPRFFSACLALASLAALSPQSAAAQQRGEIVQPLPPQSNAGLNAALRQLARNPRDLGALLDAGQASLELGDTAAAIGFFQRARAVSSANHPALVGLARAQLESGRPIEALRLFAEAEQAGVAQQRIAADRALAFDLVGDNARAQELYRIALSREDSSELRRRYALSLAISGNKAEFERILLPLLQKDDRAAFRTRAFGLAILKEEDEAVSIAESLMPTDLALRMAPYLRYMPRLTRAQQAAAANLGAFPAAKDIGRDDPQIASYAGEGRRIAQRADSSLTPSGTPMGAQAGATGRSSRAQPRRRPDRTAAAQDRPAQRVTTRNAGDPLSRTRRVRTEQVAEATPAAAEPAAEPAATSGQAEQQRELPTIATSERVAPRELPASVPPAVDPTPAPTRPAISFSVPPAQAVQDAAVVAGAGGRQTPISSPQSFDLAAIKADSPSPAEDTASVADAFADFATVPSPQSSSAVGAVDITRIEAPREVERAEPPKPAHPARHWVQVATGKDRGALKFDWRRIARQSEGKIADKGPFVTPWGEANRLLAGPYASASDAREIVSELKALGVDSFTFSSAEGEEIEALN
ncbi:MAG: SPOR domain-containing protein [Qipengyuania sp.]